MQALIKKNLASIIFIFILIIGSLASLVFLRLTFRDKASTKKQMDSQQERIKDIIKDRHGPPSREMVSYWSKRYEALQDDFQQAMNLFDRPSSTMPDNVLEPLAFKEKLLDEEEKLRKKAARSGISLPASLGFEYLKNTIPKKEDVPILTKRLEILQRLIDLMAQSGITILSGINFYEPVDRKADDSDNTPFYRDFGLTLGLVGETEQVVKFLYQLEVDDFMFVVNGLTMEKTQMTQASRGGDEVSVAVAEDLVKANLQISTCVFLLEKRGGEGES